MEEQEGKDNHLKMHVTLNPYYLETPKLWQILTNFCKRTTYPKK